MTPEQINREIALSELFKFPEIVPSLGVWRIHKPNTPYYHEFYEVFDPYHRIDHAWMVVEKYDEMPLRFISIENIMVQEGYLWKATFWNGMNHIEARADTAPAAICLAALEAVRRREHERD